MRATATESVDELRIEPGPDVEPTGDAADVPLGDVRGQPRDRSPVCPVEPRPDPQERAEELDRNRVVTGLDRPVEPRLPLVDQRPVALGPSVGVHRSVRSSGEVNNSSSPCRHGPRTLDLRAPERSDPSRVTPGVAISPRTTGRNAGNGVAVGTGPDLWDVSDARRILPVQSLGSLSQCGRTDVVRATYGPRPYQRAAVRGPDRRPFAVQEYTSGDDRVPPHPAGTSRVQRLPRVPLRRRSGHPHEDRREVHVEGPLNWRTRTYTSGRRSAGRCTPLSTRSTC